MQDDEPLDSHTIELAETRPIMWRIPFLGILGEVPMNVGIMIGLIGGMCLNWGGIKYTLWVPVAWWLIAWLMTDNYHAITHFQKWLETCNQFCLDRKKQGGVSATPFPQLKNKYRGMI